MKPGDCCEGDMNPWRGEPVCVKCGDSRYVSSTKFHRNKELVPCPYCGDPIQRERLVRERLRVLKPQAQITEADLTDPERTLVKQWRDQGNHMQDCLRWIEGQRYDPMQDDAFLERVDKELLKSAFRNSQPEPSFHAEFKARK